MKNRYMCIVFDSGNIGWGLGKFIVESNREF